MRLSQYILFFSLIFPLILGCNHRFAVPADEAGPLVLPDGSIPDGTPKICMQDQHAVTLWTNSSNNFTLAMTSGLTVNQYDIAGNTSYLNSAAAVNSPGVAGIALTRAADLTPHGELSKILKSFAGMLSEEKTGSVQIRASGISGKNREGSPDVKETIWDVSGVNAISVGELREMLVAAAFDLPRSQLSAVPGPEGSPSTQLVVKLTVVQRTGQIALSGAVITREDDEDLNSNRSFIAEDLSNGTTLAKAGMNTDFTCDDGEISGQPVADILWVIDESGSMTDNRKDIVNNATNFFNKALSAGLDFRMGVTGVKKPEEGIILGKLCSTASPDKEHDGGEDRFLLPHEKDLFTACVLNPPYYEEQQEYGLTNGFWAVKNHLPRATNAPGSIREGAKLAVIFVTDETAHELKMEGYFGAQKGFLSYNNYRSTACQLSSGNQMTMAEFMKPLITLFEGEEVAGSHSVVHVIGGTCNNQCNAEIPYGYRDIAYSTGGQIGDVCQKDLNATLQVIIDSIIASASPRVLQHVPISSTLEVVANGVQLPRSRSNGYTYSATSNSLTFVNVKVIKGNSVVVSYHRFIDTR